MKNRGCLRVRWLDGSVKGMVEGQGSMKEYNNTAEPR